MTEDEDGQAGLLAEYKMLEDEIGSNSQLTAHVFTVTATATAALIGYGVQTRNWLVFIAPFAVLLPSLWFVTSQLESTVRIAAYVRTFIEPDVEGLDWENRLAARRVVKGGPKSKYTVSITGIYGALGLVSLAFAWAFLDYTTVNLAALAVLTIVCGGSSVWLSWRCRQCFGAEAAEREAERWQRLRELEERERT